jgi:hypothetical protein
MNEFIIDTSKPVQTNIKEWSSMDVQTYFKSGKFKDYASSFVLFDGPALLQLSENQFKEILKDTTKGILIYNAIKGNR